MTEEGSAKENDTVGWIGEAREIVGDDADDPTDEDTCSYSEELDEGNWHCHREPAADADRCLFHRPAEQTDDEALADAFLREIRDSGARTKQFVGAEFGMLDLSHGAFRTPDNHPIDLREATVCGDLNWEYATVDAPLFAEGLSIHGTATFDRTTFDGVVSFSRASLQNASFEKCEFNAEMTLYGATVGGSLSFDDADFGDDIQFTAIRIGGDLRCQGVHVNQDLLFDEMNVEGDINLQNAVLNGSVSATNAKFGGNVKMLSTRIDGNLLLQSLTIDGDFTVSLTSIAGTTFLSEATVGGDANVTKCEFTMVVTVHRSAIGGICRSNGVNSTTRLS